MEENFFSTQFIKLCKDNNMGFVGLFGSYARGEETPKSDVDLLVEFTRNIGYFELVRVERKLSEFLNKKVDLVTTGGINKYIKPYIMRDLKTIYDNRQG